MGTANWEPKWWSAEQHGSAWDKVKDAMKRDWEQTKKDLSMGGEELDQDVGDTVKQAAGKEPIPPPHTPNSPTAGDTDASWDSAERPLMYGVGARTQFGSQHQTWNDDLESSLRTDWESSQASDQGDGAIKRSWNDVKRVVRHGYEKART